MSFRPVLFSLAAALALTACRKEAPASASPTGGVPPASAKKVGLVIDVGGWDNTRAMNAPGQSGDPASPHYRDLVPMWLKGEYFPLLYTRERVEAAAQGPCEQQRLLRHGHDAAAQSV